MNGLLVVTIISMLVDGSDHPPGSIEDREFYGSLLFQLVKDIQLIIECN